MEKKFFQQSSLFLKKITKATEIQNPPPTLPPAARNPFEKGFLDLPKLFNWDGLDILSLCPFVAKNRRWILDTREYLFLKIFVIKLNFILYFSFNKKISRRPYEKKFNIRESGFKLFCIVGIRSPGTRPGRLNLPGSAGRYSKTGGCAANTKRVCKPGR